MNFNGTPNTNQTTTVQALMDQCRIHTKLQNYFNVGGIDGQPALRLCDNVQQMLFSRRMAWKFNRVNLGSNNPAVNPHFFVTQMGFQDFHHAGASCFVLINSTTPGGQLPAGGAGVDLNPGVYQNGNAQVAYGTFNGGNTYGPTQNWQTAGIVFNPAAGTFTVQFLDPHPFQIGNIGSSAFIVCGVVNPAYNSTFSYNQLAQTSQCINTYTLVSIPDNFHVVLQGTPGQYGAISSISVTGQSVAVSDSFPGPTLSSNWTFGSIGTPNFDLNQHGGTGVVCEGPSSGPVWMYWNAASFPANQSAQLTITTGGGNNANGLGLALRASASNAYLAIFGGTGIVTVLKCLAGVTTTLYTSADGVANTGDVWKFQIVGTSLQLTQNGTHYAAADVIDSSIESGAAGISGFNDGTGTPADDVFGTSWSAASIGVVGPSITTVSVPNTMTPGDIMTFSGISTNVGLNSKIVTLTGTTSSTVTFLTPAGVTITSGSDSGTIYAAPSGAPGIWNLGWVQAAGVVDINNNSFPLPVTAIDAVHRVAPEYTSTGDMIALSCELDYGNGVVKFRISEPVSTYPFAFTVVYQARAPKFINARSVFQWPDDLSWVLFELLLWQAMRFAYGFTAPETQAQMQAAMAAVQAALSTEDREDNIQALTPNFTLMGNTGGGAY